MLNCNVCSVTSNRYSTTQTVTCQRPQKQFQDVEVNRFQDNRHMKVVSLSALRTGRLYPTGNVPGTHFCYTLRIMSMKNSSDTTGNRTSELPICSAVPQPTAKPRGPNDHVRIKNVNLYMKCVSKCIVDGFGTGNSMCPSNFFCKFKVHLLT